MLVFDILSIDSNNLVDEPLVKRKSILQTYFGCSQNSGLLLVPWKQDSQNLQEDMRSSIDSGCEGLILKKGDSPYQPGSRASKLQSLLKVSENLLKIS